jgi:hypothetical protein
LYNPPPDIARWQEVFQIEKESHQVNKPDGFQKSTRRQFAKTLAAIAAAPLLPRPASSSELYAPTTSGPELPEVSTSFSQAAAEQKPSPDAEALTELVRIRYGKNLSNDQLTEVRRSLDNRIRAADRMKQFKLANGDEPAFIFSA